MKYSQDAPAARGSKRKRKVATVKAKGGEDEEKKDVEEDNDDQFQFDADMSDSEDDNLEADEGVAEEEVPLDKPTAMDDFYLDDYEDRVDYWRLHGVSEMRDMSKLRAEGEIDPGAATLEGGLHIPAWMNNRLFGYQRTGLEWMWTLHQQQAGGVMGDEMGLGCVRPWECACIC